MQENTRNHKIIASLDIYDYIIITFFVALFALVFIRNYQLKDAKLPCIFALQTEKLEQMQEGEPVKIRGKIVAYKDQLQYEHLDPGTYTYVLICEAVDYDKSGTKISYGKYKHKALINNGDDRLSSEKFTIDKNQESGFLNLTFSLPESLTYLYAIHCTVYDEEGNTVVTTYLNPPYGA